MLSRTGMEGLQWLQRTPSLFVVKFAHLNLALPGQGIRQNLRDLRHRSKKDPLMKNDKHAVI
eukprot:scaffold600250_cov19-Prasinocladus_malaysianus.AAC.1